MDVSNSDLSIMDIKELLALKAAVEQVNRQAPHRERAEVAYRARNYSIAKGHNMLAANALLENSCTVPLRATRNGGGAMQWTPYTGLHPVAKAFLMACYNSLARCCLQKQEFEEALTWTEESRFLALTTRFTLEAPLFEWIRHHIPLPDLITEILIAHELASDTFEVLGNTGMACDRLWNSGVEFVMTPLMLKNRDLSKMDKISTLRHPDPKLTADIQLKYPELQVLGSWKKLSVKKGAMKPRLAFASFIWHGRLYVGGGFGDTKGPFYRDLCVLDLIKLDTWRALPSIPYGEERVGRWFCWHFAIHNDRAYLFVGNAVLDYFDLRTETWGTLMTTGLELTTGLPAADRMVYTPICNLKDSTQQVVGDNLYVFGGSNYKAKIGSNLFVVLNLKTLKWRRLSGELTPGIVADYSCPGPRRNASSWADPARGRIYLFGGECDRTAGDPGDLHLADNGYAYEDFWSWDIKEEAWRMERLVGNLPCPRSEAACVYNPSLDKAFIFGGYNPAFHARFENNIFPFSYFADTFMFCPEPKTDLGDTGSLVRSWSKLPAPTASASKWKHVLTRGFPTYRAQSQLLADPDTGKMYLFGGYTNTDWVRSGKLIPARTFCDLWELRVDVPGGGFEDGGVDLAEEARTAKVGPWQRCFACGSAGRWKKCGGSCKGRAFFCDSDCLVDGWKQHKQMHGCRKVT